MIEVKELRKAYAAKTAVDGLSFEVGEGKVVGFLGPNGAGKTTTLRILSGFIGPTSGQVTVFGSDVTLEPRKVQAMMGYMPESCVAYPELRVAEYLRFRARLKRVSAKQIKGSVERAMGQAGIEHRAQTLVGHLSKGYKQRLGLADALVADPPLLVLDEPTSGLDPNQIREVRSLIKSLGGQRTILLSTHILSEVEASCDEALVLNQGRCVAQGTIQELRGLRTPTHGELLIHGTGHRWPEALNAVGELDSTLNDDSGDADFTRFVIRLHDPEQGMQPVLEKLNATDFRVHEARLLRPRLEDIFAQLTHSHRLDSQRPGHESQARSIQNPQGQAEQ